MRTSRKLKILFVMDAFRDIHLEYDTTLSIIMESNLRGHEAFHAEPKNLLLKNRGLFVHTKRIHADRIRGFQTQSTDLLPAARFDVILIRKDPPFDLEYLYMTHLLEHARGKTLLINDPTGIRNANEKLFSFQFKQFMPESLIAKESEAILEFRKYIKKDLILKPLNRKAGEGIFFLSKNARNASTILKRATHNNKETIIAQEFIKSGWTEGDKRILLWDGIVLGAFQRIPKRGEFRSNLSLGGSMKKATLTTREQKIVATLKPVLQKNGLIFVGLDLVGETITEINVTSPAGIPEINELDGKTVETQILDWIERRTSNRRR